MRKAHLLPVVSIFAVLAIMTGCNKEIGSPDTLSGGGASDTVSVDEHGYAQVPFSLSVADMEQVGDIEISDQTKSMIPESSRTTIHNCYVLIFDPSTGERATYTEYGSDGSETVKYAGGYFDCDDGESITPKLLYGKAYNIYFLTNATPSQLNINPDNITTESQMSSLKWTMPNYETEGYAWIMNEDNAFPMASVYENYTASASNEFVITPLIGEYVITLDKSIFPDDIDLSSVEVLSCRLKNAPADISPFKRLEDTPELLWARNQGYKEYDTDRIFASRAENVIGEGVSGTTSFSDGDAATYVELNALNGKTLTDVSTPFHFYYLENMNGVSDLLASNTDPALKRLDNLDGETKIDPDLVQYLEYRARVKRGAYYEGGELVFDASIEQELILRFCLGMDNVKDFSMPRNRKTNLNLIFKNCEYTNENWKGDKIKTTVNRQLAWHKIPGYRAVGGSARYGHGSILFHNATQTIDMSAYVATNRPSSEWTIVGKIKHPTLANTYIDNCDGDYVTFDSSTMKLTICPNPWTLKDYQNYHGDTGTYQKYQPDYMCTPFYKEYTTYSNYIDYLETTTTAPATVGRNLGGMPYPYETTAWSNSTQPKKGDALQFGLPNGPKYRVEKDGASCHANHNEEEFPNITLILRDKLGEIDDIPLQLNIYNFVIPTDSYYGSWLDYTSSAEFNSDYYLVLGTTIISKTQLLNPPKTITMSGFSVEGSGGYLIGMSNTRSSSDIRAYIPNSGSTFIRINSNKGRQRVTYYLP